MMQKFLSIMRSSATQGDSVDRLACALALGAYVAFCPFIGLHTLLIVLLSWLFRLNMPAMLVFSNIINNPWTLVPVYATGYACGEWILARFYAYDTALLNPAWVGFLNESLTQILGVPQLSFYSFMLGGNLVGVIAALVVYPLAKICIMRARFTSQTC